jgi:hypothetical protein
MPDFESDLLPQAPNWGRTIVYHASLDALGPRTDAVLSRLGYQMLAPEALEAVRADHPEVRPEMLIVDERRIEEVEAYDTKDSVSGSLPIILLTGKQGARGDDPRVVGAVKRPAGLHDLYRLMQQVFEDVPRATPRVATQLRARCEAGGNTWESRILSLSENGCLLRSPEAILLGQKIRLELVLPRAEAIALEGEATYQLLPDTGLVFSSLEANHREALGRFVTQTILS